MKQIAEISFQEKKANLTYDKLRKEYQSIQYQC